MQAGVFIFPSHQAKTSIITTWQAAKASNLHWAPKRLNIIRWATCC